MALPTLDPNAPEFTRRYVNLADPRLGAQALEASDEFFAPKDRMLNRSRPSSFRASTTSTASGWTAGKRAASA